MLPRQLYHFKKNTHNELTSVIVNTAYLMNTDCCPEAIIICPERDDHPIKRTRKDKLTPSPQKEFVVTWDQAQHRLREKKKKNHSSHFTEARREAGRGGGKGWNKGRKKHIRRWRGIRWDYPIQVWQANTTWIKIRGQVVCVCKESVWWTFNHFSLSSFKEKSYL